MSSPYKSTHSVQLNEYHLEKKSSSQKRPPNPSYYFWYVILLLVIPVLGTLIAEVILKYFFVEFSIQTPEQAKRGKLHLGYAYYVSLLFSTAAILLVVNYLRKRFLIYDIEKKNLITFFWTIVATYLFVELAINYFQPKWWQESFSNAEKWMLFTSTSKYYLYLIPHLVAAILIFFALRVFIWISDIDSDAAKTRLVLKKIYYLPAELEHLIDTTKDQRTVSEQDFENTKKEILASKEKFTFKDYQLFLGKIQ